MAALDTLVNPPFANDPPVKVNFDAKVVGLVVAILAGLGALLSLLALLGLLGASAVAGSGFAGIFFLALIGVIVKPLPFKQPDAVTKRHAAKSLLNVTGDFL